jgi:hypothetical protein
VTRDEMKAALDDVKSALHEQFPGHDARLDQFDSHLATVAMVVDHIHDEDVRHQEGN